ncbi:MAG: Hsp70 family protein [Selenomonadaceae bacterium]|nr:Hsp70 family protein [Selenomonadaceae bacterium]
MYLGIDLGTTNSVVARSFVDVNNHLITEVIKIGQYDKNDNWTEESTKLPSMVYFTPNEIIVGEKAKDQRGQDREHVVTNAKRFIGTHHTWTIDDQNYEATDISAIVLQHCKRELEHRNLKYDSVVITVPASFTPDQSKYTVAAAVKAGFREDQVTIKHEPTAALLSYIDEQSRRREVDREVDFSKRTRVLVFDLGGGTCDTAIIDVTIDRNRIQFEELGIGRYKELGGIDFDARLADKLLDEFFKANNIYEGKLTRAQKDEMYRRLLLGAETIKELLTARINSKRMHDPLCDPNAVEVRYNIPDFYDGNPLNLSISKQKYDEYTKDLYIDKKATSRRHEDVDRDKNVISIIRETLEEFHIDKDSIDYVFMTGGMTKFPTVQEKIFEYVGKPLLKPADPMNAVAVGAAVYQYYNPNEDGTVMTGFDEPKITIDDQMTLAESIMLNVSEGLPHVIIPKGTVVPYSGELRGMFRTASTSGVNLNIYAGIDPFDSSMRIQQTLKQKFKSPVNLDTPFDIRYSIDENKSITMSITIDDGYHEPQELELSIYGNENIAEQDYNIKQDD